jgi:hypothetical protein
MSTIVGTVHNFEIHGHRAINRTSGPMFCPHTINWLLCEGLKYQGEHDEHDHVNRFALAIAGVRVQRPYALVIEPWQQGPNANSKSHWLARSSTDHGGANSPTGAYCPASHGRHSTSRMQRWQRTATPSPYCHRGSRPANVTSNSAYAHRARNAALTEPQMLIDDIHIATPTFPDSTRLSG